MTAEWLHYLNGSLQQREEAIVNDLLQVPDYPPLPSCPQCHVHPAQITSRAADPDQADALLVDFQPCGHAFAVPQGKLYKA